MWNTVSVCLSRSAECATEAISLALHSVSHALNYAVSQQTIYFYNKVRDIYISLIL